MLGAITVSGCGSSDNNYVVNPGGGVAFQTTQQQQFGMVYLGRIAPDVRVDVLAVGSDTPLASVTANASGQFMFPAGTALPEQFRLSAMTPEGHRVERFVEPGEIPYLYINALSTIISRYKQAHPEDSLAQIEEKVRLGLLEGEVAMFGTNDSDASPFSPRVFLARAEAAGGIIPYADSLVETLEDGGTVSFRGEGGAGRFLSLYKQSPEESIRAQVGEVAGASFGYWLLGEAGSKIVDEVSYRLTGKVNGAAGTSFGDAGSFEEVSEEIGVVEDTITSFQTKIADTFMAASQARITNKLSGDVAKIDSATTATVNTANWAHDNFSSTTADQGPRDFPSDVTSAVSALDFITSTSALSDFSTAFTATTTTDNLFLAANQNASSNGTASANNAPPAAGSTPSGAISHTSTVSYDYYGLRHDLITQPLVNNYGESLGYLNKLANLVSESANLSLLPTPLDQATGYSPPATALNTGMANIARLYGADAHTGLTYVPQPVGTDLVLIDCENRLMWYLPLNLCKYDVAQNGMIGLNVNGWTYPAGTSAPTAVGNSVTKDLVNYKRSSTMPGWRVPEVSELQTLRSQIVAAGGGSNSDSSITSGLQNLGFSGLSALSSSSNFKKFWYNGAVTQTTEDEKNNIYADFDYFDMEKNEVTHGANATFFDPKEDPLYTAVYVRTLNFSDSTYFGDTTQQIYKAYGQAPTSLTAARAPVGDPTQATVVDYSSASGYHSAIQDHATPYNRIQDWLTWTVELPSSNTNPAGVTADDIAYLSYVSSGSNTPGGTSNVRLIFKRPGTVVVRGTAHDPISGSPASVTFTESSNIYPRLTSIGVSPQNVAFSTIPTAQESERFYCTGYLANGLTVDLTSVVNWDVVSSYGSSAQPPWDVDNTSPYNGLLQFGDPSTLLGLNTLRATYTPGTATSPVWTDSDQSMYDDASFAIPVR